MYDASVPGSAPRVRIALLADALAERVRLERVEGGRWQRLARLPRFITALRRVDAVYVESATAAAMPWDVLALSLARAMGRPVGVYFRDAYQLFRDIYPASGLRQRLSDAAWRLTTRALRTLATVRFAPSAGLAEALGLEGAVLLPPGTDPSAADLGPGNAPLVAYVGAATSPLGFDRLLAAMELVRIKAPATRLLVVSQAAPMVPLPDWVDLRPATRDELPSLLAPAAACVLPLPINGYTNLARAVRLADFLSWGKPIVATATTETRALLEPTGAGLLVDDEPAAIAEGLLQVLGDDGLAARLSAAARALAVARGSRWQDRAALIADLLMPAARKG
jgi:glycosyltransferase involved in cell wall biosynthesis